MSVARIKFPSLCRFPSLHERLLLVVVCLVALAAVVGLEAALWFKGFVAAYFTAIGVALLVILRSLRQPRRPAGRQGRLRLGRRWGSRSLSRAAPWLGALRAFRIAVVLVYGHLYLLAYFWILLLGLDSALSPWSGLREFFSGGAVAVFSVRAAFHTIAALLIAYLVFDAAEYVCVRGAGSWQVWIAYAFAFALAVSLRFAVPPARTTLERAEEYARVEIGLVGLDQIWVEGRQIPAEGLLGILEDREREIQARPIGPDQLTVYLRPNPEVPLHELHRNIMRLIEAGFDQIRLRGAYDGNPYEFRYESVKLRPGRGEVYDENGIIYLRQYPRDFLKQWQQERAIERMVDDLLKKACAESQQVDITLCGGPDLTCRWLWIGLGSVGTAFRCREGRDSGRHVVFELMEHEEAVATTVVRWSMVEIGPADVTPAFP